MQKNVSVPISPQDDSSVTLLNKHLCLLLPYAAETFRRSTILLEESSLDKHVIQKLHSMFTAHTLPAAFPLAAT